MSAEPSSAPSAAPLESALYELVTALQTPVTASAASESMAACVVCRLSARSVERWLRTFLAEYVNDPAARETLRRAQGFCGNHTRVLSHLSEALGIAILYADLARLARERWQQSSPARHVSFWQKLRSSQRGGNTPIAPCPACIAQQEAETRYIRALANGLSRSMEGDSAQGNDAQSKNALNSVWQVLEANAGLCVPHVTQVAACATPVAAVRLIKWESERLAALQAELETIIRKNDYRFRNEPWGEEKDAWKRALEKLRRG